MKTVDHIAAGQPETRKAHDGFTVTDDLAGLPVTEAELDAIEAFLSSALRDLFAADSQTPQNHAERKDIPKRRGARP